MLSSTFESHWQYRQIPILKEGSHQMYGCLTHHSIEFHPSFQDLMQSLLGFHVFHETGQSAKSQPCHYSTRYSHCEKASSRSFEQVQILLHSCSNRRKTFLLEMVRLVKNWVNLACIDLVVFLVGLWEFLFLAKPFDPWPNLLILGLAS